MTSQPEQNAGPSPACGSCTEQDCSAAKRRSGEGGEEFKAFEVPLGVFHCAGDPGRNLQRLSMDVLADNLNCRIRSAAGGSDLQFYMDELVIVGSH